MSFSFRRASAPAILLLALTGLVRTSYAAEATPAAETKVEIKANLPTTMEEIAAVDVLSEICPKLLQGKSTAAFQTGYQHLLASLLPGVSAPAAAVKTLHDDKEYLKILDEARSDASKAGVKDNKEVCLDVIGFPASHGDSAL